MTIHHHYFCSRNSDSLIYGKLIKITPSTYTILMLDTNVDQWKQPPLAPLPRKQRLNREAWTLE